MTPSSIAKVPRSRKGTGEMPPNPKQWAAEQNGLDLREQVGAPPEDRLQHQAAFALLPNVSVVGHGEIPAAACAIDYFRARGASRWSGLALPCWDGRVLVIYNDAHPITRVRATLLEEFFHLRLNHQPSTLRLLGGENGWRTHNDEIESEAYASGAAALVPYSALKKMHLASTSVARIAAHFQVSPDLVRFRLKVTRLFRRARPG